MEYGTSDGKWMGCEKSWMELERVFRVNRMGPAPKLNQVLAGLVRLHKTAKILVRVREQPANAAPAYTAADEFTPPRL